MNSKKDLFFLGFLCALSIGGAVLVYIATARIGPGVSTDGTIYLSVASNLLKGRGFIDLYGSALVQYPPLYPALIALVSWLTRADIFLAGRYINIATFGLIIFFSGILFRKTYPDRMLFAYIGSIFIATSLAVIDTSASILSDPLFMLFVVLFLLAARSFVDDQKSIHLFEMGLIACLASLDRYAGMSLILVGAIFLIYFYWKNYVRGLVRFVLFCLSGLPIILWGFLHNYPLSGKPFGSNSNISITGNIYISIVKIFYWFFPYGIIKIATPFGLLIAILLILILLNRTSAWQKCFQRLFGFAGFANSLLIIIYLGLLIVYTDYYATNSLDYQRYHMILMVPLLIVLFAIYEELIPPRMNTSKIKDGILLVVFIVWLVYPLSMIQAYEQEVQINGEISNNTFNFVNIRESDFLKPAESLPLSQQIYSNYEPAAWFYLRRDILSVPRIDSKSKQINSDSLTKFQDSINSSGGGYLVWFNTIHYRENLPSLDQLQQAIKMQPLFTSDVGDIYRISSKAP
ncbi:MAG: hypothetical protein WBW94_13920 [Anaerolineales bacterium]